ncbi:tyrosine-protein phosphatase [Selenihalanaerobacter shriftii]|uniref:protein-tyrosine-phosphatase n=1 Tax=Selenihalanaerobacter shriftii TaxID=142842 RepID=A0A1T4KVM5_9FIRM|nr:CpsB/CapC family capsule biosynthesis tyrosine phosphatase [Selenihalanaerobacter shriftii]SJZ46430.1 protein-tyrosine phosphatase [Selenihalanaerobacter shriftii]
MIDLHTHILPGIDDGVKSVEEALEVAKEAKRQGVKKIVATPHYLDKDHHLTPKETNQQVNKLQKVFNQAGINIKILPGAEVYLTTDLGKRLKEKEVSTINNSRYLLVELPMAKAPSYVNGVFYDLKVMGYTPIISHPERYDYIIKNPNLLYKWIKDGAYAQLNAGSLLGIFGSRVQQTAEILVKHNLVQVIGSDLHSNGRRGECLEEGFKKLIELIGTKANLYLDNSELIINDKDIKLVKPLVYKESNNLVKRIFGKGLKIVFN